MLVPSIFVGFFPIFSSMSTEMVFFQKTLSLLFEDRPFILISTNALLWCGLIYTSVSPNKDSLHSSRQRILPVKHEHND